MPSCRGVTGWWKSLDAQDEELKRKLYDQQYIYVQCKESNSMVGRVIHVNKNTCKVEWFQYTQSQLMTAKFSITNKDGYIKESKLNILVPEKYLIEKKTKVNILLFLQFYCYCIVIVIIIIIFIYFLVLLVSFIIFWFPNKFYSM